MLFLLLLYLRINFGSRFPPNPLLLNGGMSLKKLITSLAKINAILFRYKFYVHGLREKLTDEQMMGKPSFDFAFTVSDWLLGLDPSWAREFYCTGTYDSLLFHLGMQGVMERAKTALTSLQIPIHRSTRK